MPRSSLAFRLSGPTPLADLLLELALHAGLEVRVEGRGSHPVVIIEIEDSSAAIWEVRSTIRTFDEGAVELPGPVPGRTT